MKLVDILKEAFSTPIKPSSKEFEAIVDWLSDEYDFNEIEDMLSGAKIYKENDIITIQYSNGAKDKVKYHDGKVYDN